MEPPDRQRLAAHLRSATEEVFSMMLGVRAEAGVAVTRRSEPMPSAGVLSFIGLAGAWAGTGCLSCSPEMACRLSSLLLGSECASVDENVLDSIAELTNMIIGNVKTVLESDLGPMGLSIPTVIFGRNFMKRTSASDEWVVIPYSVDGERMEVQLCLTPSREFNPAGRASSYVAPPALPVG